MNGNVPASAAEVLMWPFLWVVIGLVVWFVGLKIEFNTENTGFKWLALAPIAIALFIGGKEAIAAMDFAYQAMVDRKMTLYAHYVAAVLPLIGLGVMLTWNQINRRQNRHDTF